MLLSPAQKAIVTAPKGNILVMATAGSGKTRVLTERIRYLLSEEPDCGVLALTFTNKAADEMKSRIGDIADVESRCFVGTIHAFAQEVVEKHGAHLGLATVPHLFERDEDRLRLVDEALRECQLEVAEETVTASVCLERKERRAVLVDWLGRISEYKRSALGRLRGSATFGSELIVVADAYQRLLESQNAIDFDDLLILAFQVFNDVPAVADNYARSYGHVCVDEAQDLNAIQYGLLQVLCRDRDVTLMLVGDENQAIYGFNGSSAEFMKNRFVEEFAPKQYRLRENYRSTKLVLVAANALNPGSQDVAKAALLGRVECRALPDEEAEASWICDTIGSLLQQAADQEIDGALSPERMVVIARNRYVFGPIEKCLTAAGLEWHVRHTSGAPKFESMLGMVLDNVMHVVLNPRDALHARALTEFVREEPQPGDRAADLMRMICASAKTPLHTMVGRVYDEVLSLSLQNEPDFLGLVESLQREYVDRQDSCLETDAERESAAGDLTEWLRHWESYVHTCPMGAQLSLRAFRSAMAMGHTHPKSVKAGIALSTVHTMKCAESDVVFLIGLSDGTFPDYRAIKTQQVREERNSAFVAVTRARRWLYLTYPELKRMPWGDVRAQSPSRFFTEVERAVRAWHEKEDRDVHSSKQ